jgi:hypothetical protein
MFGNLENYSQYFEITWRCLIFEDKKWYKGFLIEEKVQKKFINENYWLFKALVGKLTNKSRIRSVLGKSKSQKINKKN